MLLPGPSEKVLISRFAERKEQNTRLRCLASAMPKPVMPPGAMKSAKLLQDEKVQGSGSMKTP